MSTVSFLPQDLPRLSLIARMFPQRELVLKRSWIIGGYGRPLPKRRGPVDTALAARPLPRPYQLRREQIIAAAPLLELREDQIIGHGPRVGGRRLVRVVRKPTVSASAPDAVRA